jgi:hypothetical protein
MPLFAFKKKSTQYIVNTIIPWAKIEWHMSYGYLAENGMAEVIMISEESSKTKQ